MQHNLVGGAHWFAHTSIVLPVSKSSVMVVPSIGCDEKHVNRVSVPCVCQYVYVADYNNMSVFGSM